MRKMCLGDDCGFPEENRSSPRELSTRENWNELVKRISDCLRANYFPNTRKGVNFRRPTFSSFVGSSAVINP